ncbi:hypothetical protein SBA4_5380001 [Candidatus Sulfopaludibacter sp. SbA4]|nr:hypothetical protein SBA4_5380001 [Candidatus Sulfopaludibacter sp. SbA4]
MSGCCGSEHRGLGVRGWGLGVGGWGLGSPNTSGLGVVARFARILFWNISEHFGIVFCGTFLIC